MKSSGLSSIIDRMCCECDKLKVRLAESEAQLAKSELRVGELSQELKLLAQQLDAMRRRIFGPSSDKIDPNQPSFDGLLKECDALNGNTVQLTA